MRPLVFLEMVDVLCISAEFGSREMPEILQQKMQDGSELWAGLVDADAAANLRELDSEFSPLYVISSSWATYLDQGKMCDVVTRTQLEFVVDNLHAEWRTPGALSTGRRDEIEWWLDAHRRSGQPFLIIDDSYSGIGLATSGVQRPCGAVQKQVRIHQEAVEGSLSAAAATDARGLVQGSDSTNWRHHEDGAWPTISSTVPVGGWDKTQ